MRVEVGMEVHRKRSQVALVDEHGGQLLHRNLANNSAELAAILGRLEPGTAVALEAAYGWGWLAELPEELELEPHLVHPRRCKAIASARRKDDRVDARTLAQLLGAELVPEPGSPPGRPRPAWLAAPPGRPGPDGHRAHVPGARHLGRPRRRRRGTVVGSRRSGLAGRASPAGGPASDRDRLPGPDRRHQPAGHPAGARPGPEPGPTHGFWRCRPWLGSARSPP
jgi:Transposase